MINFKHEVKLENYNNCQQLFINLSDHLITCNKILKNDNADNNHKSKKLLSKKT